MAEWSHIDPWANESKANLRWLSRRSGATEERCLAALRDAKGNLQLALRRLAPSIVVHKYPDWYYLGPFKVVEDPDRDMPVREKDDLSDYDIENESDRMIDGERLIAPFNDSNTLSDIVGCILAGLGYPKSRDPELNAIGQLQWNLAETTDRIREKAGRGKNAMRNGFFEDAIRVIELAKDLYFDRRYADGEKLIIQAEKLLREGNKTRASDK
jgi:hypothetical protein